jgi:hypothetical protein
MVRLPFLRVFSRFNNTAIGAKKLKQVRLQHYLLQNPDWPIQSIEPATVIFVSDVKNTSVSSTAVGAPSTKPVYRLLPQSNNPAPAGLLLQSVGFLQFRHPLYPL